MRVLIAHSAYSSATPSGENIVAEAEARALRNIGVESQLYLAAPRNSLGGRLHTLSNAGMVAWNPLAARQFAKTIRAFQPQIVHFHNLFPHLSPSVIPVAKQAGAKVVMTLHNYRWFCVNGLAFRAQQRCHDCAGGDLRHAINHKCYRSSRAASWQAARFVRSWQQQLDAIDHFFVLSPSQEKVLVQAGIPRHKLSVKPNFYSPQPEPAEVHPGPPPEVLYLGRLGPEKGLQFLISVWKHMGEAAPRLDIVGEGEDRRALEEAMAENPVLRKRLRLHGMLPHTHAQALLRKSRLLVVPSLWAETFGLNVLEASRAGVPVLASPDNGPSDLLQNGVHGASIPLEPAAWSAAIQDWLQRPPWPQQTPASEAQLDPIFSERGGAHRLQAAYQQLLQ